VAGQAKPAKPSQDFQRLNRPNFQKQATEERPQAFRNLCYLKVSLASHASASCCSSCLIHTLAGMITPSCTCRRAPWIIYVTAAQRVAGTLLAAYATMSHSAFSFNNSVMHSLPTLGTTCQRTTCKRRTQANCCPGGLLGVSLVCRSVFAQAKQKKGSRYDRGVGSCTATRSLLSSVPGASLPCSSVVTQHV
jgi:hypothetical protein